MANWKRKKCRKRVRCTLCTDVRWLGNKSSRLKGQGKRHKNESRQIDTQG